MHESHFADIAPAHRFKHYQSNYGKSSSANLFAVGPDLDDKDSQTSGSTSSQVDLHKQGMTDVYEQSADAEDCKCRIVLSSNGI
jgi:hypothetical protein